MVDALVEKHTIRNYIPYIFLGLLAFVLIVWCFFYLVKDRTVETLQETGFQSQNASDLPPSSETVFLETPTSVVNAQRGSDEK